MKTSRIVILSGLILLALAVGACSSNNKDEKQTGSSKTSQQTTSTEETKPVTTIEDSITAIDMKCQSTGATESTCQWDGKTYIFDKPTNWSQNASLRKKACDEGYVNTNYQMLSDGASFTFTTDYNEDLQSLNTALSGANANVRIVGYCG